MWSVKDPDFIEENNGYPGTRAFRNISTQSNKEFHDIIPPDVAACGSGKDKFECAAVFPFHVDIVPYFSTMSTFARRLAIVKQPLHHTQEIDL